MRTIGLFKDCWQKVVQKKISKILMTGNLIKCENKRQNLAQTVAQSYEHLDTQTPKPTSLQANRQADSCRMKRKSENVPERNFDFSPQPQRKKMLLQL